MNKVEAEMILCVFQQLMRHFPELTKRPATAVITPYKAQVRRNTNDSLISHSTRPFYHRAATCMH